MKSIKVQHPQRKKCSAIYSREELPAWWRSIPRAIPYPGRVPYIIIILLLLLIIIAPSHPWPMMQKDLSGHPWRRSTPLSLRQRPCPLSYCIDEAVYNQLLSAAPDTRSRALVLSTSLPHARDWLNVVPTSMLGLHLQDREFRLCLHYWLGCQMKESPT